MFSFFFLKGCGVCVAFQVGFRKVCSKWSPCKLSIVVLEVHRNGLRTFLRKLRLCFLTSDTQRLQAKRPSARHMCRFKPAFSLQLLPFTLRCLRPFETIAKRWFERSAAAGVLAFEAGPLRRPGRQGNSQLSQFNQVYGVPTMNKNTLLSTKMETSMRTHFVGGVPSCLETTQSLLQPATIKHPMFAFKIARVILR